MNELHVSLTGGFGNEENDLRWNAIGPKNIDMSTIFLVCFEVAAGSLSKTKLNRNIIWASKMKSHLDEKTEILLDAFTRSRVFNKTI